MEGLKHRVATMEEANEVLERRVEFLTHFVSGQMVKAIIKQFGKIEKDPTDVKMIDVVEALNFSTVLELSPELEEMVEAIQAWHDEYAVEEEIEVANV